MDLLLPVLSDCLWTYFLFLFAAVKHDFRTILNQNASQPDIQILQPINLQVLITRNLAASWYGKLPGVQVQGVLQTVRVCFYLFDSNNCKLLIDRHGKIISIIPLWCSIVHFWLYDRNDLKPEPILQMNLGEEDLSVLMKILVENIGEGGSQQSIDAKRHMVQGRSVHYCW